MTYPQKPTQSHHVVDRVSNEHGRNDDEVQPGLGRPFQLFLEGEHLKVADEAQAAVGYAGQGRHERLRKQTNVFSVSRAGH